MLGSMATPARKRLTRERARSLRKDMTAAELSLWQQLRGRKLGVRFHRQDPIGPFIADFVCRERHLVVEADGAPHERSEHDVRRDEYLSRQGYRVLRFWNRDIAFHLEDVLATIRTALEAPPSGRGE
ncbi:MAG: DUF559 domain-containing protein [Acidimicrobiia bacterium]|nr:DUF559 domain-containing protein [Acidimicrobiia bacterium]NNL68632.1 DUF559 domain-containing protein [Acidimicrobiia bacterium]